MDFRHQIVTCLFSMLRLSFETQKIKENYAILTNKNILFLCDRTRCSVKRNKVFSLMKQTVLLKKTLCFAKPNTRQRQPSHSFGIS